MVVDHYPQHVCFQKSMFGFIVMFVECGDPVLPGETTVHYSKSMEWESLTSPPVVVTKEDHL